jgi:amidase
VIGRFWHVGALARRVQDLVTTLPLLAGPDGHDPLATPGPLLDPADVALDKLRIAYYTDNGIIPATAETVQVVKQAAQVFADHGATVEEARPAGIEQSFDLATRLFAADGGAGAQMLLQMAGTTQVSPLLQRIGQILQPFAPANIAELAGLLVQWDLFQGQMLAFMDRYDAILCPVNAFPAMAHGTTFDEDRVPAFSYTMTYNLTGWPAVVVRGGTSPEGLPIGVQVVARPWREDIALAIGQQFEDELGGWQKPSL